MLIPLKNLIEKYQMKFTGILHIGAHDLEEMPAYIPYIDMSKIVWVDGLEDKVALGKTKYPQTHIEHAVVSNCIETVTFHRTNNGQSSSFLELGVHKIHHPHIFVQNSFQVETTTLQPILNKYADLTFNFINLDIQGTELKALQGMESYLEKVDYIYTEVNSNYVYTGCALVEEIDAFLGLHGFVRVETCWCGPYEWGDAFYIKPPYPRV